MNTVHTPCGIPVTGEPSVDLEVAVNSSHFRDWLATVDPSEFYLRRVHFQSVDMFGSKVGFIKFQCYATHWQSGKDVPGIVFARGGSVAILPVLRESGQDYTVITRQPRLATGQEYFEEICAGMLDGDGNVTGVAMKELREELGMEVNKDELLDMGALAQVKGGYYLSPGASPEAIHIFTFVRRVSRTALRAMEGKCTGATEEGEQIQLKIVPIGYLLQLPDMKSGMAYLLYKRYKHVILGRSDW
jgi:ADP-sugar diphosphatase